MLMFSSTRLINAGSSLARRRLSGSRALCSRRCDSSPRASAPLAMPSASKALPRVDAPRNPACNGVSTTPAPCPGRCSVSRCRAAPATVADNGGRRSPRNAACSSSVCIAACCRAASSLKICCCAKLSTKRSPVVGVRNAPSGVR